jgi:MFS transporter, DHA2 family, multidrug resistance protein
MEKSLVPPRYLIVTGLAFIVISLWQMTGFNSNVTQSMITWTGFIQGFGLGFIFVPLSTLAFATLDPALRTEASSIFGLMRTIGSSLGISIVVSQLATSAQREHAVLTENITAFNPLLQHNASADIWDINTQQGLALLDAEVTRQALQIAYIDDFQLIMIMALVAVPAALLLRSGAKSAR